MALTPKNNQTPEEKKNAQDDVLMREIDDAVREDQYREFATRYGKPLLGVVVAGLLAFGGFLWWSDRQETAMGEDSETLNAALEQIGAGNLDTANATLQPLADGGSDAAVFAAMLQGGLAQQRGNAEEAGRIFAAVAADGSAPQELRDLATVREVAARYDAMTPADVVSRLKPLAVPGNAYFGSAGELVAMAYLDQGKRKEAGTLFGTLAKDDDVPESIRFRARQMAGLLGVDAIDDVEEVLDDAAIDNGSAPAAAGQ